MLKLPYLKLLWISVALLFITSIAFSPVSAMDQQTAIVQAQQYADQAQGYVQQAQQAAQQPVPSLFTSTTSGNAPLSGQFQDRSSNNPTSWSWDFGDGTRSSGQTASRVYSSPGYFTVTLTVTNSAGSATASRTMTVTQSAPVVQRPVIENLKADFTYEMGSKNDMSVNFFDDTKGGDIKSWSWDFGDGSTSSERNPSHKYNELRTYKVTLTIIGVVGNNEKITGSLASDKITKDIPVSDENHGWETFSNILTSIDVYNFLIKGELSFPIPDEILCPALQKLTSKHDLQCPKPNPNYVKI